MVLGEFWDAVFFEIELAHFLLDLLGLVVVVVGEFVYCFLVFGWRAVFSYNFIILRPTCFHVMHIWLLFHGF